MSALSCTRCGTHREIQDNFCRSCGHQLTVNLPAVRLPTLPARTPSLPQPLVNSVAVLAVGTGIEWLARRFGGTAARLAGRALISAGQQHPSTREASGHNAVLDEIVYIRKLEIRR